jgi:hypothetical protein
LKMNPKIVAGIGSLPEIWTIHKDRNKEPTPEGWLGSGARSVCCPGLFHMDINKIDRDGRRG